MRRIDIFIYRIVPNYHIRQVKYLEFRFTEDNRHFDEPNLKFL